MYFLYQDAESETIGVITKDSIAMINYGIYKMPISGTLFGYCNSQLSKNKLLYHLASI